MKRLAIVMVVMKLVIPNCMYAVIAGGDVREPSLSDKLRDIAVTSQPQEASEKVIQLMGEKTCVTMQDLKKMAQVELQKNIDTQKHLMQSSDDATLVAFLELGNMCEAFQTSEQLLAQYLPLKVVTGSACQHAALREAKRSQRSALVPLKIAKHTPIQSPASATSRQKRGSDVVQQSGEPKRKLLRSSSEALHDELQRQQ